MKKIIFVLGLSLIAIPVIVGAHGTSNFSEIQSGSQMMQYLEDQVLGDELHEEMEDLMIKMMQGDLSEQEASRLSNLMEQYPGPHGMMMNRLTNYNNSNWNGMWGMHSGFGGYWSFWNWIAFIGALIWLIVGIMLIVFLGKKVAKK